MPTDLALDPQAAAVELDNFRASASPSPVPSRLRAAWPTWRSSHLPSRGEAAARSTPAIAPALLGIPTPAVAIPHHSGELGQPANIVNSLHIGLVSRLH